MGSRGLGSSKSPAARRRYTAYLLHVLDVPPSRSQPPERNRKAAFSPQNAFGLQPNPRSRFRSSVGARHLPWASTGFL